MKRKLSLFALALLLVTSAFITIRFYSYIFAKRVTGEILAIDRVTQPTTVIANAPGSQIPPAQLYSFAVAVRDQKTKEIFTASSEDRQWAVVQKGQCVEAKFLVYPFWELEKSGTYFGARLIRLFDCPGSN